MTEVTLTSTQTKLAYVVGESRQKSALLRGSPDRHGFTGDGLKIHVDGAGAEYAAAIALNVCWTAGVDTYKLEPDLPPDWEVRRRSEEWHDLIVRPDDVDERRYLLVTGTLPKYTVRGWIAGTEAKQEQWLKDYGGRPAAYFVPQGELHGL